MEFGKKFLWGSNYKYVFEDHNLDLERYMYERVDENSHDDFINLVSEHLGEFRIILQDYITPMFEKIRTILNYLIFGKSKIIYVVGARDSGKTCLSFFLVEQIYNRNSKVRIAYVGVKINKKLLPDWIQSYSTIDEVPNGYLIILDELAIQYNARESSDKKNITLGQLLSIARHKDLSVIAITQDPNMGDINVWRLKDMIIYKRSNTYELPDRDRKNGGNSSKVLNFWRFIKQWMKPKFQDESLFEYQAENKIMSIESGLPSFWSDELSKAFSNYNVFAKEEEEPNKKSPNNKRIRGRVSVSI